MKKLRDCRVWSTTAATLVFAVALTLVVTSCGSQSESPVAPSGSGGQTAVIEPLPPEPTPTPTPTPTPGGEGCTPGYWKQPHHFDSWEGFTPAQTFLSVFGVNAFPGMTLLQVLEQGGGGLAALGRHAVAALLNAASSDVSFPLSEAQVIADFVAAFNSGDADEIEDQKDAFELLNTAGCPLN